jgi:formamidopyrimidine-DNA glycosylase
VYQQRLCPNGHVVHRIRAGGRSAHFCPVEQKLYRLASI